MNEIKTKKNKDSIDKLKIKIKPITFSKLKENGYTISSLSRASPAEISNKLGVGMGYAKEIIDIAQESSGFFQQADEIYDEYINKIKLSTGSSNLDSILNGGVETGAITEFFGKSATGKTQLLHQFCVTVQLPIERGGLGTGVIYLDCEGTFHPDRIIEIAPQFPEVGVEVKKLLHRIEWVRIWNFDSMCIFLDKIVRKIKNEQIKLLVIDSITRHFNFSKLSSREIKEIREKFKNFFRELKNLADSENVAIVITNQMEDTNDSLDPIQAIGGVIVQHGSTDRIKLRRFSGNKHGRIARIVTSPHLPEAEAVFYITQEGIVDKID